jgi:hypothetical protein
MFNEPPSEAWVLAQDPADPVSTPAGRLTKELVRDGLCCYCMGLKEDATNRFLSSQRFKFKYRGKVGRSSSRSYTYPWRGDGNPTGESVHVLLEPWNWYGKWELERFPGVTSEDIWLPRVPNELVNEFGRAKRGMTQKELNDLAAEAQAEMQAAGGVLTVDWDAEGGAAT